MDYIDRQPFTINFTNNIMSTLSTKPRKKELKCITREIRNNLLSRIVNLVGPSGLPFSHQESLPRGRNPPPHDVPPLLVRQIGSKSRASSSISFSCRRDPVPRYVS